MVDMTWNSVLRSLGEPRLEICLFFDSKVPDWQGGASTPAKSTHFSCPSVSLEALLNNVLISGNVPSNSVIRLFLRLTLNFIYWSC